MAFHHFAALKRRSFVRISRPENLSAVATSSTLALRGFRSHALHADLPTLNTLPTLEHGHATLRTRRVSRRRLLTWSLHFPSPHRSNSADKSPTAKAWMTSSVYSRRSVSYTHLRAHETPEHL